MKGNLLCRERSQKKLLCRERERDMGQLDHRSAGSSEEGQEDRRTDERNVGAHASQWPMDR